MEKNVVRLYPVPAQELALEGLYLDHELRQYARETGRPFVYSNYIASLDGRIAIPHPSRQGMVVPKQTANERDWRLFQELAVQADMIISSGRYLRDYADGRAQEILQVHDDPRFEDLKAWRLDQGLPAQPDLAIISGSLRFPVPDVLTEGQRSVVIFTTQQADGERVKALQGQGARVITAGESTVEGKPLIQSMFDLGYRTIYNSTGPKVLHLLLADDMLDRLYLSHASRLLGGQPYSSIVEGPLFEPAIDMKLEALYYDPHGLDGLGQLFTRYDRLRHD